MKRGQDIAVKFPGLFLVHHNKPALKVAKHAHDERHLIIPLRGEVRVLCGDDVYAVAPGRTLHLPPGAEHEFVATNDKEGERLIALIDNKVWKKVAGTKGDIALLPTNQLAKELLFYLLLNPKTRFTKQLVETFLMALAEQLDFASQHGSGETSALIGRLRDPRLQKAAQKLEKDFREEVSIPTLAREAGLSPRNLTRLFMQETGVGPKELLIRLRLEEARGLLKDGRSVTETAYDVGYGSLSRFIQSYRAKFGRLPSEEAPA